MVSRVAFRRLGPTSCTLSLWIHLLLISFVSAQVGTLTQDITTLGAYANQKACAQSCIVNGGFCPRDMIGEAIGCYEANDCKKGGWSKNDCYCRMDLQNPAQEFITSCVSKSCTVGDVALDASTAGAIYAQYCKEKGYPTPTAPATIIATTTSRGAGDQVQTTGQFANPAATSTAGGSPSPSSKMSITTIIGIVVGSLVGLIVLGIAIKMIVRCVRQSRTPKPTPYPQQSPPMYQPPVYPMKPFAEHPYYPPPESELTELTPEDSRSVVSGTAPGFAPLAPTLLSGEHGHHPQYPYYAR